MNILKKERLIDYHIITSKNSFKFIPFKDEEEEENGFNVYTFENENLYIVLHASFVDLKEFENFIKTLEINISKGIKKTYKFLKEVFQLYVWQKKDFCFFTLLDYLGIGTNYYIKTSDRIIFFSNFLNVNKLNIKLKLNKKCLFNYLSLGYNISDFEMPYNNIKTFKGATCYKFYDNYKIKEHKIAVKFKKYNNKKITKILRSACQLDLNQNNHFGITAGKDSLALVSLVNKNDHNIKLSNFGELKSADVIQGGEIAEELKRSYTHTSLVSNKEFLAYSNEIAEVSGGLSTCSYVDMLKYVKENVEMNYSFVMGEGGECVRDFFKTSNNLEESLNNYITPINYLKSAINFEDNINLDIMKQNILEKIKNYDQEDSLEATLLKFYRYRRMPGNFSNRTKLINRYRLKFSPFLNIDFIKMTYNLPLNNYNKSELHRDIIKENKHHLLPYFDNPMKSNTDIQNWNQRYFENIRNQIISIIQNMSSLSLRVFDKNALIDLAELDLKQNTRSIYFLLRIISFILFLDKNEEIILIV